MKIILAPDSFKGTLSSKQIIEILREEAGKKFSGCDIIGIPMADGGEGTEQIMVDLMNGTHRLVEVCDPLGRTIRSGYGVLNEETALVEMASASGLTLIETMERNPWNTSTYGTGQLIRQALEDGYRKLIVAVGGSATNDGGMGAMRALGVRFLDQEGNELAGTGADLGRVCDIDMRGLHPALKETEIVVMCDVENPLVGSEGATYVFGPQKGADPQMLSELEAGMNHYAEVIERKLQCELAFVPGTGAAGGLSGALKVFCGAKLQSGVETILETVQFRKLLADTDLVITGEGRVDGQSVKGKVLAGIGQYCQEAGVPAAAIVGGMGPGAKAIYEKGILTIMPTVNGFISMEEGLSRAEELLRDAAKRMFQFLAIGMQISSKISQDI